MLLVIFSYLEDSSALFCGVLAVECCTVIRQSKLVDYDRRYAEVLDSGRIIKG